MEENKFEEANVDVPETEVVADEVPWEIPAEVEVEAETKKEKKAREKQETKATKAAKKQKRIERRNTKTAKFIRVATIWILAFLIIFLAGFATSHITVARPAEAELEQVRAELIAAEAKVASIEGEIENLSSLEADNESLQAAMGEVNIHVNILSARVAVTDALLALQAGDLAEVKLELGKVEETFKTLKSMLNADQKGVVENMEQRLALVVGELDEDTTAVENDLKMLSSKLISLENTLFANP
ncbi:MAG: hypothetical protein B6I38_09715 [Anaerolineaceae bacterium 4572_5.1]|nr:MAG: hypothetical protein B6I38_09715 [Anaerolineaceae bacterium 4572_5.1]RLD06830.1 MAG: hypothetical protein DRI56_07440 [Chloroflexota bacterium]